MSTTYNVRWDLVSQVNANNEIKAGFDFYSYDLHQNTDQVSYAGDGVTLSKYNSEDWTEKPLEVGFFIQDKMEFQGMILNGGVRVDAYNAGDEYYTYKFDPLGEYSDIETEPTTSQSEWKVSVGPRLGIAHPITESAVLHFQYGYFFQRKAWYNILRNYYTLSSTLDQRLATYGNRDLNPQKTAAYEVGIRKSFQDMVRLSLTGYYKDIREQAQGTSYTNTNNITFSYNENRAYADARGMEIMLDTVQPIWGLLSFMFNYEYAIVRQGAWGFAQHYELEGVTSEPSDPSQTLRGHVRENKARGAIYFTTPPKWGPKLFNFSPLGYLNVGLHFIYIGGEYFTYHQEGDPSRAENNLKWDPNITNRLRVMKRFKIWGIEPEFYVEIYNFLNRKELDLYNPRVGEDAGLEAYLYEGVPGEEIKSWGDIPLAQFPWANTRREIFWGLNVYF